MKSSKYISKFKLPPQEVLIDDWSCALSKSILFQGRLYLSQGYVCFHSNVFGKNIREAIRFEDILTIKKKNKFAIGIEIHLKNEAGKYFFCSFISRSKTYKAICTAWKNRCGDDCNAAGSEMSMTSLSSSSSSTASSLMTSSKTPQDFISENSSSESDSNDGDDVIMSHTENGNTNELNLYTPIDTNNTLFLDSKASRAEVFPPTEVELTPEQYFYLILSDFSHEFENGIQYLTPRKNVEISKWNSNPDYNGAVTREIKYIMSLVELHAPIGPPETRVADTTRYVLTKDRCTYQIKSFSLDIPYGDCFHIEAEWTITLTPSGKSSFVAANAGLVWTKRCLMKSIVEGTTMKQIRMQYSDYFKAVVEWVNKKKSVLSTISFGHANNKSKNKKTKINKNGENSNNTVNKEINANGLAVQQQQQQQLLQLQRQDKCENDYWKYIMNGLLIVFALVLMYLSARVSRIEKMITIK